MLRDPRTVIAAICSAALASAAAVPSAAADAVTDFYKGRTMTMVVSYSPGGTYDINGRLTARHIAPHIPGSPNMIVQNMPGAGGIKAANYIYNVAPKDGSLMAIFGRAVPQAYVLKEPGVRFDPLEFTWIGSPSSYGNDGYLAFVQAGHAVRSVADLKAGKKIILGAGGPGSTNFVFATFMKEGMGFDVDIIKGYEGAAPIVLAMQRGEVDGTIMGLSSIKAGQRDLLEQNKIRPLVMFARETPLPEMPDVPPARDLIKNPDDRAALEFAEAPFLMALPFLAPPEVPADRARALRSAFMAMMKDAVYLKEARKLGLDISPIDGARVKAIVQKLVATPKAAIARYQQLVPPKKK